MPLGKGGEHTDREDTELYLAGLGGVGHGSVELEPVLAVGQVHKVLGAVDGPVQLSPPLAQRTYA